MAARGAPAAPAAGAAEEEEVMFTNQSESAEDASFDEMVGALENVLIDPAFVELQHNFGHRLKSNPANK